MRQRIRSTPPFLGGKGAESPHMINMINISPVLSTFCGKMLKTGEMLIMLIVFFFKTVIKIWPFWDLKCGVFDQMKFFSLLWSSKMITY